MRKVDFRAASVGSAALILSGVGVLASTAMFSGSAVAQPAFNTVPIAAGGVKTCTVGTNCTVIASDSNFTQIQFDSAGKTYIGTKLADSKTVGTVTETFAAEDFVQVAIGGTQAAPSGILSQSTLKAGTEFTAVSEVRGGWAAPTGVPAGGSEVKINLLVANGAGQGLFQQKFDATVVFDPANNTNKANALTIDQTVGLSTDAKNTTDKQRFVSSIATAAGNVTLATGGPVSYGAAGAANQGQIVWVGQDIAGVGKFGTTSVTNGTAATFTTSLTNSLPVTPWPSPGFGTVPAF